MNLDEENNGYNSENEIAFPSKTHIFLSSVSSSFYSWTRQGSGCWHHLHDFISEWQMDEPDLLLINSGLVLCYTFSPMKTHPVL
jgi:hypothetical protein